MQVMTNNEVITTDEGHWLDNGTYSSNLYDEKCIMTSTRIFVMHATLLIHVFTKLPVVVVAAKKTQHICTLLSSPSCFNRNCQQF